mmetsp:Transcript_148289/g.369683  ORF Transcript_148289/g.369683 Transcript_148289/m.369683 type:complete len:222 (+) Transcript_148289:114-779(+)
MDLARDTLSPDRHRPHVSKRPRVGAVDLTVLASLDGVACGIIPIVCEAVKRQYHGTQLADGGFEMRLVAVGEELAMRGMRASDGKPVTLVGRASLGLDSNSFARADVWEGAPQRPGVVRSGLDETGGLQERHVDHLTVEDSKATCYRESAGGFPSHDRVIHLLPGVGGARLPIEGRQQYLPSSEGLRGCQAAQAWRRKEEAEQEGVGWKRHSFREEGATTL